MTIDAELTTTATSIDHTFPIENQPTQAGVAFPDISQRQLAWEDILDGCKQWRIWLMLAYQDIKLRYRRSVLGPFWITISMAVTVYSMGFLYSHLFHIELSQYYPFVVASMLAWSLVSSIIIEMTDGFTASESIIKQIKLPYTLYIHRIATRNLIIFFHNMLVIVPILIIFHDSVKINFNTLAIIPGLALSYINAIIYGMLLALICARFRDMAQIIKSLVQVIFFLTPVMWDLNILPESKRIFIKINPFYSFIEIIRAPLLGKLPTLFNLGSILFVTIIGLFICLRMFTPYRSRIVYWL
jgi:lipopolysaccharide transport system permease protein